MSAATQCPNCLARYRIKEEMAGRKAKCAACGKSFVMAVDESAGASGQALKPDAATRPVATSQTNRVAPQPQAKPPQPGNLANLLDEALAEGPPVAAASSAAPDWAAGRSTPPLMRAHAPSKRKRSAISRLSCNITRLTVIPLIIGVALLVLGWREWQLCSRAKPQPQRMSLADLAAHGPGDNIYIELTDIGLLEDDAIVLVKKPRSGIGTERQEKMWFPAVPHEAVDEPPPIKVIVKTYKCGTDAEVAALCSKTTMRGMVINDIERLNDEEARLIGKGLPAGTDVSSCYIFEEGREPYFETGLFASFGGGLALVFFGLILILRPSRE